MMLKIVVKVLPMNNDEVARAEVIVRGKDSVTAPWNLESGDTGAASERTFELEDGQELSVSGRTIGRMVLNRDQRATQVEYLEGETPPTQSAYDPEKDPVEQKRREEEKARAEGRRSPSAFVDPAQKSAMEVRMEQESRAAAGESPKFTPIEQPRPEGETETQAAARRLREEQQRRDTTGSDVPSGATTTESKQATDPKQPASPASLPSSASSSVGSSEPAAASAPGGARSSKDVTADGAKSKT